MLLASDYLLEHGRLPRLREDPAPWLYRGWLLWYVQEIQRVHPAIPDRWGYLAATFEKGCFLADPIPKIEFSNEAEGVRQRREIEDQIKTLTQALERHGYWSSFCRLVEWIGFALGSKTEYPKEVNDKEAEQLYRTLNIGPWLLHPFDYLGRWVASNTGRGWNPNAFYPTPHTVCEAMVLMMMSDLVGREDLDPRAMSVNDPCVGTGRMILHASNYSMNISAQDIDPFVLDICKINATLYAPWVMVPPVKAIALAREGADQPSSLEIPNAKFVQGKLFGSLEDS